MKKLTSIIALALAALISIGIKLNRPGEITSEEPSIPAHADALQDTSLGTLEAEAYIPNTARSLATSENNTSVSGEEDIAKLKLELETAKAELEKLSRPFDHDVLSSTVNGVIRPGETLVTGGYQIEDGNYEITFLTPRSVKLSDGTEGIEIASKVLSVGPEFVEKNGLESLATNARNTLQHGEAWKQEDVQTTMTSAGKSEGVGLLSSPRITTRPSLPFSLRMGGLGGAQFTIEGTVEKNADGDFSIQSRVERTYEGG